VKVSPAQLAGLLDTPNGTQRDLIHEELVFSRRSAGAKDSEKTQQVLARLATSAKSPAVRLQALCVLDGLGQLNSSLVEQALADAHPAVRANAIRLSEQFTNLIDAAIAAAGAPEPSVRFQATLSLGQWPDLRASGSLGKLAATDMAEPWLRAAVLSSASQQPGEILKAVLTTDASNPGRSEMINQLIATAVGAATPDTLATLLDALAPADEQHREVWQLAALNSLLNALDRKKLSFESITRKDAALSARLGSLLKWARELAIAPDTDDATRESAVRLLGREPEHQAADLELLVALLERPLSSRCQSSVVGALKRMRSSALPTALLKNWNLRGPTLRQSCIEILVSRDEWAKELLAAIQSGTIGLNEISPASRQRMVKHADSEISHQAAALFKNSQSGSRTEILARYQSATTLPGDAARGSTVFATACATCHALRGQGHAVGPNLAPLADKSPADFVTAILDPNAAVEPRFVAYNVFTKDGRSLNGIVSAESGTTLTLVQSGGVQESILRGDIESIRASGLSLMPEGLEQNLKPQDLADLVAYIKTSPRAFGSATPEQAAEAKKKFLSGGVNGLSRIVSSFEQLPYPSWLGELPMAYCRQTDGSSKLVWEAAPVPGELKPGAAFQFRLPIAMGFQSQQSGKFHLSLNGRAVLDFDVALTDQMWQSKDAAVRMSYTVMENNDEDSNGVLMVEVSNSLLEPGKPARFEVLGSAANSQRWFGTYLLPGSLARAR
jgi:putative heme-binding domain-containing protein